MKTLNAFYRLFPSRPEPRASLPRCVVAAAERPAPANDPKVLPLPGRYRPRSPGTGYGRSSGYAQDRSYTEGRGDRLVRVG